MVGTISWLIGLALELYLHLALHGWLAHLLPPQGFMDYSAFHHGCKYIGSWSVSQRRLLLRSEETPFLKENEGGRLKDVLTASIAVVGWFVDLSNCFGSTTSYKIPQLN